MAALFSLGLASSFGLAGNDPPAVSAHGESGELELVAGDGIDPAPPPQPVIYGEDDRVDLWQVSDPALLRAAQAACLVVDAGELFYNSAADAYELAAQPWTGLGGDPICEDERFYGQPVVGDCSALLVAPDIVVTAGHCLASYAGPGDRAFVFGFEIDTEGGSAPTTIPADRVYFLSEIINRTLSGLDDHAVVRLDRAVAGIDPVVVRPSGEAAVGTELVMIGHPSALPKKVTPGATVRRNQVTLPYFEADLDAYGGNSGSMVLNAATLEVEGILVRGNADFAFDGPCLRSRVLDPTGIITEEVTRASVWRDLIPTTAPFVTGSEAVVHSGPAGGPFVPGSASYTITNPFGGEARAWSVTIGGAGSDFLSLDGPPSGVLDPGQTVTLGARVLTAKSATPTGLVRRAELTIEVDGIDAPFLSEHYLVPGQPLVYSANVPRVVPDLGSADAVVFVPDDFDIHSVDVDIMVEHTYVSDLTIELMPPVGSKIMLHNREGGDGDLVAGRWGTTGKSPSSGSFTNLIGESMSGVWRLRVIDYARGDAGSIEMFSVRLRGVSNVVPAGPADLAPPIGVLDTADITAFVTGFVAHDVLAADMNGDGVLNSTDVNIFIYSFLTSISSAT